MSNDVIALLRDATAYRSAVQRYQFARDHFLREMAKLHAAGHHQKAYEAAAWAGWCSRALQAETLDPEPRDG